MTKGALISVCVPCYDRPEMLRQLVDSFRVQEYSLKELIISDDSPGDSVGTMMQSYLSPQIKYFKNVENLGYGQNFRRSIERATGSIVLMLGDDDALLSPHALGRYVAAFAEHPNVGYVYSNQIQFNNKLQVEYLSTPFTSDSLFLAGRQAFEHIWTTSIFIPGLALRNIPELLSYYPREELLFPQLEMVGHVIARHDAFGLGELLIAGRAHKDQLGFYAMKGERIKGGERHGTLEVVEIFERLAAAYDMDLDNSFLSRDLISRFAVTLFKERLIVGKIRMQANYRRFCAVTPLAASSRLLKLAFIMAFRLPAPLIGVMRLTGILVLRLRKRRTYAAAQAQLCRSVGAS